MINAMIVTNVTEGLSQKKMSEYLQNIQKTAAKYNFRIVKAIVDHSGGEKPFFTKVFNLIKDIITSVQCDAVILDDTFSYDTTESYNHLKKLADRYNTSIYHFEDNQIFMPDENNDFDYGTIPFEVFELAFTDECDEDDDYDSFAAGITEARQMFEDKVNDWAPCERNDAKLRYAKGMINAAGLLLEQADDMQNNVREELEKALKKHREKKE